MNNIISYTLFTFVRNTKREKDMDKLVVMQGVRFDEPIKTTSEGVPVALEKTESAVIWDQRGAHLHLSRKYSRYGKV